MSGGIHRKAHTTPVRPKQGLVNHRWTTLEIVRHWWNHRKGKSTGNVIRPSRFYSRPGTITYFPFWEREAH